MRHACGHLSFTLLLLPPPFSAHVCRLRACQRRTHVPAYLPTERSTSNATRPLRLTHPLDGLTHAQPMHPPSVSLYFVHQCRPVRTAPPKFPPRSRSSTTWPASSVPRSRQHRPSDRITLDSSNHHRCCSYSSSAGRTPLAALFARLSARTDYGT